MAEFLPVSSQDTYLILLHKDREKEWECKNKEKRKFITHCYTQKTR